MAIVAGVAQQAMGKGLRGSPNLFPRSVIEKTGVISCRFFLFFKMGGQVETAVSLLITTLMRKTMAKKKVNTISAKHLRIFKSVLHECHVW